MSRHNSNHYVPGPGRAAGAGTDLDWLSHVQACCHVYHAGLGAVLVHTSCDLACVSCMCSKPASDGLKQHTLVRKRAAQAVIICVMLLKCWWGYRVGACSATLQPACISQPNSTNGMLLHEKGYSMPGQNLPLRRSFTAYCFPEGNVKQVPFSVSSL